MDSAVISGMDDGQSCLSQDLPDPWTLSGGPICIEAKQSVEKVHQLASRSVCVGNRCLPEFMSGHGRICIPTFALRGRCLQKVLQERCPVVLVAPVWDMQHWYPLFLKLLVVLPILLLVSESLLQDPFNSEGSSNKWGQLMHEVEWYVKTIISQSNQLHL